jgi:hypothetical protein
LSKWALTTCIDYCIAMTTLGLPFQVPRFLQRLLALQLLASTALVSACVVSECAGGTRVTVVNRTTATLYVDSTPTFEADGGVTTLSIAPGASLLLIEDLGIGLSALPPEQTISRVRVYNDTQVFYDGVIEPPGFTLETRGRRDEACYSESYILDAM